MTEEIKLNFKLTVFEYLFKDSKNSPTKAYNLTDGKLVKTLGKDGRYAGYSVNIDGPSELAELISESDHNTALLYGINKHGYNDFVIVPDDDVIAAETIVSDYPVISRTRKNFEYPDGPGILFVDFDDISNPDIELEKVYEAVPAMRDHPHVVNLSSGSNIATQDGTVLKQKSGIHAYWFLENASKIPEYSKILGNRLVLNGHGYIKLSDSGARLERNVIDLNIYQPERLDFQKAVLNDGLTYFDHEPSIRGLRDDGRIALPSDAFKQLSKAEDKALKQKWADLRGDVQMEIEHLESEFINDAKTPEERKARQVYIRSRRNGQHLMIQSGFTLATDSGKPFIVDDIFNDIKSDPASAKAKWHGLAILDPDTNERGKAKLYLNNDGSVRIHSFKNGGKSYRVVKCPVLQETTNIAENANLINDVLLSSGHFYRLGASSFVQVKDGKLEYYSTNEDDIRKFVQNVSDVYFEWYSSTGHHTALPMAVAKQFIAAAISGFDEISKVSKIPGIDRELNIYGRSAGYHKDTRTYFVNDYRDFSMIDTQEQAKISVEKLLSPYTEYLFADGEMGKAHLLAAVLTSIFRPMLRTAPGIAITTPMGGQNTGKTVMAEAIAKTGGWGFAVKGWGDKSENDKKIHSHLVGSSDTALYFDNVSGYFSSDVMAAILTAEYYAARELGKTRDLPVATNVLTMVSGNAFSDSKDMAVRFFHINLIPQEINRDWKPIDRVDHVEFVSLAFALVDYVKRNYNTANIVSSFKNDKFPHWDTVVRMSVKALTGYDVMALSADRAKTADIEDLFEILVILDTLWKHFDNGEVSDFTIKMVQELLTLQQQEALTDKFRMKINKFPSAFAKYARGRNELYGGKVAEYLLETVADRKTDGVETKRYRLAKQKECVVEPMTNIETLMEDNVVSLPKAETRREKLKTGITYIAK